MSKRLAIAVSVVSCCALSGMNFPVTELKKQKRPDRKMLLPRTNTTIRGATLLHFGSDHRNTLFRDTFISPATDVCPHVTEYCAQNPLCGSPAPSAVHLPIGSDPTLSTTGSLFGPSSTLSPLQRFDKTADGFNGLL